MDAKWLQHAGLAWRTSLWWSSPTLNAQLILQDFSELSISLSLPTLSPTVPYKTTSASSCVLWKSAPSLMIWYLLEPGQDLKVQWVSCKTYRIHSWFPLTIPPLRPTEFQQGAVPTPCLSLPGQIFLGFLLVCFCLYPFNPWNWG